MADLSRPSRWGLFGLRVEGLGGGGAGHGHAEFAYLAQPAELTGAALGVGLGREGGGAHLVGWGGMAALRTYSLS
jgi:hypothetical protein